MCVAKGDALPLRTKPYVYSCCVKVESLLCLKKRGSTSRASPAGLTISSAVPSADQRIVLSVLSADTKLYNLVRNGASRPSLGALPPGAAVADGSGACSTPSPTLTHSAALSCARAAATAESSGSTDCEMSCGGTWTSKAAATAAEIDCEGLDGASSSGDRSDTAFGSGVSGRGASRMDDARHGGALEVLCPVCAWPCTLVEEMLSCATRGGGGGGIGRPARLASGVFAAPVATASMTGGLGSGGHGGSNA